MSEEYRRLLAQLVYLLMDEIRGPIPDPPAMAARKRAYARYCRERQAVRRAA